MRQALLLETLLGCDVRDNDQASLENRAASV